MGVTFMQTPLHGRHAHAVEMTPPPRAAAPWLPLEAAAEMTSGLMINVLTLGYSHSDHNVASYKNQE